MRLITTCIGISFVGKPVWRSGVVANKFIQSIDA